MDSDSEEDDGEEQHPARKSKFDCSDFGAEELSAKFKEMSKQMKAMLAQQRRLSERRVPSDRLSPPRKARKLNLKEIFDRQERKHLLFLNWMELLRTMQPCPIRNHHRLPARNFSQCGKSLGQNL
jgi:hypothetical protein